MPSRTAVASLLTVAAAVAPVHVPPKERNTTTMTKHGRAQDLGWLVKNEVTSRYRTFAAAAARKAEPQWSTFKRDAAYTSIVGVIDPRQGEFYLRQTLRKPQHASLFRDSFFRDVRRGDVVGGASTFSPSPVKVGGSSSSAALLTIGAVAPVTLRYLSVLADLIDHRLVPTWEQIHEQLARGSPPRRLSFCEVGGGFGGMAHVTLAYLRNASGRAGTSAYRYRVFDLPEPAALQRTYLSELGFDAPQFRSDTLLSRGGPVGAASGRTANEEEQEISCDVAISNYALSELDLAAQDMYIRRVMGVARRGVYAVMNIFDESRGGFLASELARRGFQVRSSREAITAGSHYGSVVVIAHRAEAARAGPARR